MNLSRSPYIIEISELGQEGSKIELFLWTSGVQPLEPAYTLNKLIPASNSINTYYNISPYVREFYNFSKWQNATGIASNFPTSTNYIVNYAAKRYKLEGIDTYVLIDTEVGQFMDGYGYYMDGYNPSPATVYLDQGTYLYDYNGAYPTTQGNGVFGSFDVPMLIGDTIRYTNLITGATVDYTTTALDEGVRSFARVYLLWHSEGNKVEKIIGGSVKWTSIFKPLCESKYEPIIVDFINRYGSWSRIYFQKSSQRSIDIKTNQYKFNPKTLPFSPSNDGQIKSLNTNAKERIKLNTGWVNDSYGEYIQQLLLSERVTLLDYNYDSQYNPVTVKNKSLEKFKGINKGVINYSLEFEFAYDLINTVV
tara:strand:- start:196 stop:1287 length:1092 start_codon:yes stop_codon:yes gene_type:complete